MSGAPEVLAGAPPDRAQVRRVQTISRSAPGSLLGLGQGDRPNPHGGPGGEPQTLGHPLKAAKSGDLLGQCHLTLEPKPEI